MDVAESKLQSAVNNRNRTTLPRNKGKKQQMLPVTVLRFNDDIDIREELFNENRNVTSTKKEVIQASFVATVANLTVNILIDTGAVVSVMSNNLYRRIKEVVSVPTFPVQSCKILGAIGTRSQPVKMQVLVDINTGNGVIQCPFLVVDKLVVECILGLDLLREKAATIDFSTGICEFESHNDRIKVTLTRTYIEPNITCPGLKINLIRTDNTKLTGTECYSNEEHTSMLRDQVEQKISETNNLTEIQRGELRQVLIQFLFVFRTQPGLINCYEYQIKVRPHEIYCHHTYPIPWAKRDAVMNELKKMMEWNVIEPSTSPYCNPLLAVSKPDNTVRLVLDARAINKIIEPVRTRPENLEEQLLKFYGVKYLSSFDLRSSYWQVPLNKESRKYTAFIVAGRSYQFQVLPFGISTASGIFITALDKALGPEIVEQVTLYVDDILIATTTWDEHLCLIHKTLQRFEASGITANLRKSKFAREQLKFLGHLISPDGIKPDPDKISAIKNFPYPYCKRQLRAFYGLCSFFRRFLPNQALNSTSLLHLLKKNTPWVWTPQCERDYDYIKDSLVNSQLLHHPDMTKEFCLVTDASNIGLGSCIFQIHQENGIYEFRAISFASRTLSECERSYTASELETLAIVWSFKKFNHFIYGRKIKVYCDHQALSCLLNCKLLHRRLERWFLTLQEYDFEIVHIPGKDNVVADALSRLPEGLAEHTELKEQAHDFRVLLMLDGTHKPYYIDMCRNMATLQEEDHRWRKIRTELKNQPAEKISTYYTLHNEVLFYRRHPKTDIWCVCIPESCEETVILYTHVSWGHYGTQKCLNKLRIHCYFPNMRKKLITSSNPASYAKRLNQEIRILEHIYILFCLPNHFNWSVLMSLDPCLPQEVVQSM